MSAAYYAMVNELVQPQRRITQVSWADDVVSLKYRACLVPGHLHRDAFRHACSHEIPHRSPAEVMRNRPWG